MKYVDGFVIVVPRKNLAAYREMAEIGVKLWKKHGALEYVETVGEDLNPALPQGMPPEMQGTTFPKMAGAKRGETVIFSFIVFKSRAHRDEVNAKVMKEMDEEMKKPEYKNFTMPYDPKRQAYGGFRVIVQG